MKWGNFVGSRMKNTGVSKTGGLDRWLLNNFLMELLTIHNEVENSLA